MFANPYAPFVLVWLLFSFRPIKEIKCPRCGSVMKRHPKKPRYFCPNEECSQIEERFGYNPLSHKYEVLQMKIDPAMEKQKNDV